jgi:hypothetical protein
MVALISAAAAVTGSDTNLNMSLHGSAAQAARRRSASDMAVLDRSTSRFRKKPKECIGVLIVNWPNRTSASPPFGGRRLTLGSVCLDDIKSSSQ